MSLQHPDYATLPIIVGGKAQPGAFYVSYSGHYLSHIANDAYGSGKPSAIMRLNKSKYNVQHCIYRTTSNNCNSAKVTSESIIMSQPNSYAAVAWLSLCGKDRAGQDGLGSLLSTPYQVIWVPTADGKEPWDIEPPITVPKTPGSTIPGFNVKTPVGNVTIPGLSIGFDDGSGSGKSTPTLPPAEDETPVEEPKKAGMPWWLGALLGLGALTTVIVFAVRDKKKGKKRKKAKK
jgi:hypothetical protein